MSEREFRIDYTIQANGGDYEDWTDSCGTEGGAAVSEREYAETTPAIYKPTGEPIPDVVIGRLSDGPLPIFSTLREWGLFDGDGGEADR